MEDTTQNLGEEFTEEQNDKIDGKKENYPSAEIVADACLSDYQRIQENYNRQYDKINITLAFAGVVLTIMLGTLDLSIVEHGIEGLKIWQVVMMTIELVCHLGGLVLIIAAIIWLLILMKGRKIAVFESEGLRDKEIYKEKKEYALLWLIDKYTKVVNEDRQIIADKQRSFDRIVTIVIIGIVMYAISIILQKGGF